MKKSNPKEAAKLMAAHHGITKALRVNADAIEFAKEAGDAEAVERLKKAQRELLQLMLDNPAKYSKRQERLRTTAIEVSDKVWQKFGALCHSRGSTIQETLGILIEAWTMREGAKEEEEES